MRYVRSHFLLNGDPIKDWTFRRTRFYLVLRERRVIDPDAGSHMYRTLELVRGYEHHYGERTDRRYSPGVQHDVEGM